MRNHALALLGFALHSTSAAVVKMDSCSDVTFNIPVVSQNVVFAAPPDSNNMTDIIEFMHEFWGGKPPALDGTRTVSDTFTIKGTYCLPKDDPPKGLEILVHGMTYNKTMWAGEGFPAYSYHAFATGRGYATLALDRLGHGANPQRPDPLNIVQPQVQIDLMHAIFSAARSTSHALNPALGGRTFPKVIYTGHSFGSFLGAALAAQYPSDADALVLTGYNSYNDFTDVSQADWVSAADAYPARFGDGLPKGYVSMSNVAQRTAGFFAGAFDPAIPPVDFAGQDTLTDGELGALGTILGPVSGYGGDVLVVTAVNDAFFCEAPRAKCEQHLQDTAASFPDASSYDYFSPENTGHDLTLHYSFPDTAQKIHDWLDSKA